MVQDLEIKIQKLQDRLAELDRLEARQPLSTAELNALSDADREQRKKDDVNLAIFKPRRKVYEAWLTRYTRLQEVQTLLEEYQNEYEFLDEVIHEPSIFNMVDVSDEDKQRYEELGTKIEDLKSELASLEQEIVNNTGYKLLEKEIYQRLIFRNFPPHIIMSIEPGSDYEIKPGDGPAVRQIKRLLIVVRDLHDLLENDKASYWQKIKAGFSLRATAKDALRDIDIKLIDKLLATTESDETSEESESLREKLNFLLTKLKSASGIISRDNAETFLTEFHRMHVVLDITSDAVIPEETETETVEAEITPESSEEETSTSAQDSDQEETDKEKAARKKREQKARRQDLAQKRKLLSYARERVEFMSGEKPQNIAMRGAQKGIDLADEYYAASENESTVAWLFDLFKLFYREHRALCDLVASRDEKSLAELAKSGDSKLIEQIEYNAKLLRQLHCGLAQAEVDMQLRTGALSEKIKPASDFVESLAKLVNMELEEEDQYNYKHATFNYLLKNYQQELARHEVRTSHLDKLTALKELLEAYEDNKDIIYEPETEKVLRDGIKALYAAQINDADVRVTHLKAQRDYLEAQIQDKEQQLQASDNYQRYLELKVEIASVDEKVADAAYDEAQSADLFSGVEYDSEAHEALLEKQAELKSELSDLMRKTNELELAEDLEAQQKALAAIVKKHEQAKKELAQLNEQQAAREQYIDTAMQIMDEYDPNLLSYMTVGATQAVAASVFTMLGLKNQTTAKLTSDATLAIDKLQNDISVDLDAEIEKAETSCQETQAIVDQYDYTFRMRYQDFSDQVVADPKLNGEEIDRARAIPNVPARTLLDKGKSFLQGVRQQILVNAHQRFIPEVAEGLPVVGNRRECPEVMENDLQSGKAVKRVLRILALSEELVDELYIPPEAEDVKDGVFQKPIAAWNATSEFIQDLTHGKRIYDKSQLLANEIKQLRQSFSPQYLDNLYKDLGLEGFTLEMVSDKLKAFGIDFSYEYPEDIIPVSYGEQYDQVHEMYSNVSDVIAPGAEAVHFAVSEYRKAADNLGKDASDNDAIKEAMKGAREAWEKYALDSSVDPKTVVMLDKLIKFGEMFQKHGSSWRPSKHVWSALTAIEALSKPSEDEIQKVLKKRAKRLSKGDTEKEAIAKDFKLVDADDTTSQDTATDQAKKEAQEPGLIATTLGKLTDENLVKALRYAHAKLPDAYMMAYNIAIDNGVKLEETIYPVAALERFVRDVAQSSDIELEPKSKGKVYRSLDEVTAIENHRLQIAQAERLEALEANDDRTEAEERAYQALKPTAESILAARDKSVTELETLESQYSTSERELIDRYETRLNETLPEQIAQVEREIAQKNHELEDLDADIYVNQFQEKEEQLLSELNVLNRNLDYLVKSREQMQKRQAEFKRSVIDTHLETAKLSAQHDARRVLQTEIDHASFVISQALLEIDRLEASGNVLTNDPTNKSNIWANLVYSMMEHRDNMQAKLDRTLSQKEISDLNNQTDLKARKVIDDWSSRPLSDIKLFENKPKLKSISLRGLVNYVANMFWFYAIRPYKSYSNTQEYLNTHRNPFSFFKGTTTTSQQRIKKIVGKTPESLEEAQLGHKTVAEALSDETAEPDVTLEEVENPNLKLN